MSNDKDIENSFDVEYLDHPCENEKYLDDIVYSFIPKEEIVEEFSVGFDKNKILSKKKYYFFRLPPLSNRILRSESLDEYCDLDTLNYLRNLPIIKNPTKVFSLIKNIISEFPELTKFKKDIYSYIFNMSKIDLNIENIKNISNTLLETKTNLMFIKFGIHFDSEDGEPYNSFNFSVWNSSSYKQKVISVKKNNINTKYYIYNTKPVKMKDQAVVLGEEIEENGEVSASFIVTNYSIPWCYNLQYLAKESNGSLSFFYRLKENRQKNTTKNKISFTLI